LLDGAGAQFNLGRMYAGGLSVEQDNVQAYARITFAAGQDLEPAVIAKKELAQMMSANQIEEAEILARKWAGAIKP
jgi:TPR repeat protein